MRKVIIMFALAMGIVTANAQENVTVGTDNGSEQPTLTKEVYPQKEADGDLYHGLTKKLTFDRMVPPHGLEVTYDKTVHVIFPSEVRYVDLGSPDLIAGKADGAENVIRVKATVRNFPNETNMSVITEDGSFYTFNVKCAAEPPLPSKAIALHQMQALCAQYYPLFAATCPRGEMPRIAVRDMSTRWGSCSLKTGTLCFALRLCVMPLPAQEYVVVHEFCHFAHPNHSPAFWAAVARVMPDYKARQALLKGR